MAAPAAGPSARPLNSLRETHPTPQFVRSDWIDLSGTRAFAGDRYDHGLEEQWFAGTGASSPGAIPDTDSPGIG